MQWFGLIYFSLPHEKQCDVCKLLVAPHWRWLALGKQWLGLCSAPGLTLCVFSGFSIHKALSQKTVSSKRSAGFTRFDSPVPGLPGQTRELPVFLTGERNSDSKERSHWYSGTLFCTTPAGCDTDSKAILLTAKLFFPLLQPCWCCVVQPLCLFWGNAAVKGLTHSSIHLLQFQFERKRSGLIFQSPLTVNGMRETSPESNSPCQSYVGGMALCKCPSLTEGPLLLSCIGSSLPNYYSKPFPEHLYWGQNFQPSVSLLLWKPPRKLRKPLKSSQNWLESKIKLPFWHRCHTGG